LGTRLEIKEGYLVAEGCPEFNAEKLEAINTSAYEDSQKIDEFIVATILGISPEYRFVRIFPDNLFFSLRNDDLYYGFNVSLPFNQWHQGVVVFLSSDHEYKGYYGCNDLFSTTDSRERKLEAQKIINSDNMKHLRAEAKWLWDLNDKNIRDRKRYFIYPKLPFTPQSEQTITYSFEDIKGRKEKY